MNTCNANQAAEKIVGQLEEGQMMAQNENRSPWWVSAVQTLGVVTVAFFLLFKWANDTVEWEREQMIPTIQKSTAATDRNTESTNRLEKILTRIDSRIGAAEEK